MRTTQPVTAHSLFHLVVTLNLGVVDDSNEKDAGFCNSLEMCATPFIAGALANMAFTVRWNLVDSDGVFFAEQGYDRNVCSSARSQNSNIKSGVLTFSL